MRFLVDAPKFLMIFEACIFASSLIAFSIIYNYSKVGLVSSKAKVLKSAKLLAISKV